MHIGVKGNERVDKVAKKVLKKENVGMKLRISKAEVKCIIWKKNLPQVARNVG